MKNMTHPAPGGASRLDNISTRASALESPAQLVMRYGPALRRYLGAMIPHAHDADDVAQDLLLQVLHKGLARKAPGRGRFRDYLKAVARNVAHDHLRRRQLPRADLDLGNLAEPDERQLAAERQWLADWRGCVLELAWRALEQHEFQHPEGLAYAVLRLAAEHPDESSEQLAERLSGRLGRAVRADAYRKQLSRSRRLFARFILEEVKQTLDASSANQPARLAEELAEVGLLPYVQPFLPPGWPAS
jgi:RNA polymerase sigma factor (sigma-70 family)